MLLLHSSVGQVFMEVSMLMPRCRCISIRRCLCRCQAPRKAHRDLAKLLTSLVIKRPPHHWRSPGASNICRRLAEVSCQRERLGEPGGCQQHLGWCWAPCVAPARTLACLGTLPTKAGWPGGELLNSFPAMSPRSSGPWYLTE